MRTLLLSAKFLAYKEQSDEIKLEHIRKAIEAVEFKNIDLQKDIENYLELSNVQKVQHITQEELDDISKHPKINYGTKSKEFVEFLKSKGLTLGKSVSKLYIEPKKEVKNMHDPIKDAIKIKSNLQGKILGQDHAIEAIVDGVKNSVVKSTDKPKMTFLFLGPPATGKTYLSKLIAESFEDYKLIEIPMQFYTDEKAGMNIYGAESNYSTATPGMLTQFVRTNPKSVVVLDEFEKAHSFVQKKLLSIFSNGTLDDLNGWIYDEFEEKELPFNSDDDGHKSKIDERITTVDFKDTIVVITSNLGSELYNNVEFIDNIKHDYEKAENSILDTLANEEKIESGNKVKALVPEMISRFSQAQIVLFNKLTYSNIFNIASNTFQDKMSELQETYNVKFSYDKTFRAFLKCSLLKFAPYFDVRRIKSKVFDRFVDKITDFMIENEVFWKDIEKIKLHVSSKVQKFLAQEIDPKIEDETLIRHLFRKNLTYEYDFDISIKEGIISLNIKSGELKQIKNIADMQGNGALIFDVPDISFEDISGHDRVKMRLKEIGNYLKNPHLLKEFDAKIPSGMLMYGQPGTGKTMMAKAFANYADLPFIQTTPQELASIDQESSEMYMKKIFARAREYAPAIIFIDELDSFGSREKGGSSAIINELLKQMDGFDKSQDEPVFVLGATNHRENIDSAILRPGRLDLHMEIPVLDKKGREYFIDKLLQRPSAKNISKEKLVMYTTTLTGAQIEKIGNESALCAIREGLREITEEILIEQINIEKYGERITKKSILDEVEATAYHEAGHAVIAKVLNPSQKIEQITIAPRNKSLGFVSFDPESSGASMSKQDIENQISISFAGRIAEMKFNGNAGLSTGASNDLKQATKLAYHLVATFGMDEELGYVNINGIREIDQKADDFLNKEIESRVKSIIKTQKEKTEELVKNNWEQIDKLAKKLLEEEVLLETDIPEILNIK